MEVRSRLICETDSNDKTKDLKCNFCVSNEKEMHLMPSYSDAFIVGSKNYKKSAIENHAKVSHI